RHLDCSRRARARGKESFMDRHRRRFAATATAFAVAFAPLVARAGTVVLVARRDATLIESASGSLANGAGPFLFAGRTSQSSESIRRAVLAFDVAAAVPRGALIRSV